MDYCEHPEGARFNRKFDLTTLTVTEQCAFCQDTLWYEFNPARETQLEPLFEAYAKLGFFTTHTVNTTKSPIGNKYWESSTEALFQAYCAGRRDADHSHSDAENLIRLQRMEVVQNAITDVGTLKAFLDLCNYVSSNPREARSGEGIMDFAVSSILRDVDFSNEPNLEHIQESSAGL